MACFLVM